MADPCQLQPATDEFPRVVAQAQDVGYAGSVELSAFLLAEEGEDEDSMLVDFIPLTLDGWRTLVELFALRHPDHFRAVVAKWEAHQQRKEPAP